VTKEPDLGRWGNNRLLKSLPHKTLALFGQDLRQVSLSQGVVCYEAGGLIDRVYFPITGMISLFGAGGEGEIVGTAVIGREGAAGLQSGLGQQRSYSRTTIQIPGHFAVISATRFKQAVSSSAPLRDLVFRYVGTLWAEAQQIAVCNAIHSVPARLCRWLLQAADATGGDLLPLKQEYLADMLGVHRGTVTALAQVLQERGAIRSRRGRITLLDRRMLERSACKCYQAIKQEKSVAQEDEVLIDSDLFRTQWQAGGGRPFFPPTRL
jgi:CRP-like cAMP-binding protein